METRELSKFTSRFSSTMVVGDAHPTSSTKSESAYTETSVHPRHSSASATPTQSSVFANSNGRSRAASHTLQALPSAPDPRPQDGPHIRFRGATTQDQPQQHKEAGPDQELRQSTVLPPPSPRLEPTHPSTVSLNGSLANSPSRIKVRDLNHIQSFASEEVLTRSRHPSRHSLRGRLNGGQQYEISAMPVTDIIEMVAGLLTKITTTNDRQHEHLHRHIPISDGSNGLSQQATSVLAFHGKNVPSITIASYLSRIHKYCPTTYEVFISLLVYFDRMTEMVNSGALSTLSDEQGSPNSRPSTASSTTAVDPSPMATPPPSNPSQPQDHPSTNGSTSIPSTLSDPDASYDISHFFVVDSFNIHRLVMAGVTCASKFFSDVFYTNSRYAKVSPYLFRAKTILKQCRLVVYPWSS